MGMASRASSGLFVAAAATALMLGGAARADENASADAAVGVGMICNSEQQAERFVALRAKGAEAYAAMNAVNKESHDPRACGLAAVAFTRDAMVSSKAVDNKLMQVVRINVLAGFNGSGWQTVSGMIQYAVMEGEGETI